ncbi:hypothetical protein NBRC116590_09360 [Pelagimonas sp. KU-00592-HH]
MRRNAEDDAGDQAKDRRSGGFADLFHEGEDVHADPFTYLNAWMYAWNGMFLLDSDQGRAISDLRMA